MISVNLFSLPGRGSPVGAMVVILLFLAMLTSNGDAARADDLKNRLVAAGVKEIKEVAFHGFTELNFALPDDGSHCRIVAPKVAAAGNPWVWRARFWDHEPDFDVEMLGHGYHLAYCDVVELWGAPKAVARWDKFYRLAQKVELGPRPVLEGMSRGGAYIVNWAKANPTRVTAIYADNPLLDLRAFPSATPEARAMRNQMLESYGITETQLPTFTGSPIDGLEALAKAKVPVFFVLGAKDDVVPIAKHADVFEARYKALGGPVHRWLKPDDGHHPHGLHPVDPLVKAVLKAAEGMEKDRRSGFKRGQNGGGEFHGRVVDEKEMPVADVEVTLETYGDDPQPVATTDAEGRFKLRVADDKWKWATLAVREVKGILVGTLRLPAEENALQQLELSIKLARAREIQVRVADGSGQPVADALVGVIAAYRDAGAAKTNAEGTALVLIPAGDELQQVYAVKAGVGLDYRSFEVARELFNDRRAKKPEFPKEGVTLTLDGVRPLQVTLSTTDNKPIPGAKAYVWLLQKPGQATELNLSFISRRSPILLQTNEQGRVTFDWIPRWQEGPMTIWPQAKEFTRERGNYDPKEGMGEVTLRLDRLVPIRGRVFTPEGEPAAGLVIDVVGAGYNHDDFRQAIKSRDDGTFEVLAAPNKVYLLIVKDAKWAAEPLTGFALSPDQPVENLEFRLRRATRIYGRVTQGQDDKPVAGFRVVSYQFGTDSHNMKGVALPNPERENRWVQPMLFHDATTDDDGRYEFFVGPGNFDIRGPNQNKIEKFEILDETERAFDFHMPRPEKGILKGLVVSGEPRKPVAGAKVHAIERWHFGGDPQAITDDDGRFELERNLHPAIVHVTSEDGSLAGLTEIDADAKVVFIALQPTVSATGVLFDEATDSPLVDQEIVFGIQVHLGDKTAPFRTAFGGTVRTDAEGKFQIKRLVQGGDYHINRTVIAGRRWSQIATVIPDKPGSIDLGRVVVKPQRDE